MTSSQETVLRAKRIHLRHPRIDDYAELSERYRASRKHLSGLAAAAFSREQFDNIVASAAHETNQYFVICRSTDDVIVGTIGLSQIFRKKFQSAYLGYQLFAGFTGMGYMTESVGLIMKFAFRDLKLHRVEANVQPNNLPSINVLKRSGFTKEGFSRRYLKIGGRWRDHERWAIIKEDHSLPKR